MPTPPLIAVAIGLRLGALLAVVPPLLDMSQRLVSCTAKRATTNACTWRCASGSAGRRETTEAIERIDRERATGADLTVASTCQRGAFSQCSQLDVLDQPVLRIEHQHGEDFVLERPELDPQEVADHLWRRQYLAPLQLLTLPTRWLPSTAQNPRRRLAFEVPRSR